MRGMGCLVRGVGRLVRGIGRLVRGIGRLVRGIGPQLGAGARAALGASSPLLGAEFRRARGLPLRWEPAVRNSGPPIRNSGRISATLGASDKALYGALSSSQKGKISFLHNMSFTVMKDPFMSQPFQAM